MATSVAVIWLVLIVWRITFAPLEKSSVTEQAPVVVNLNSPGILPKVFGEPFQAGGDLLGEDIGHRCEYDGPILCSKSVAGGAGSSAAAADEADLQNIGIVF